MATHELIRRMVYLGILSRPDVDLTYDKLDALAEKYGLRPLTMNEHQYYTGWTVEVPKATVSSLKDDYPF